MRRSWGRTSTPVAPSYRVRPRCRIVPATGRWRPASARSVRVFPTPERPKTTSVPGSVIVARARTTCPPARISTSKASAAPSGVMRTAAQPVAGDQDDCRDDGEDEDEHAGAAAVAGDVGGKHLERHRVRPSRDVASEHHRRAELAERAREGEDRAGEDAARGEREAHPYERVEPARPERVRDLLV